MKTPEPLAWGPKALRDWAEEVSKALAQLTPMPGIGTTITEDPNGGGFSVNVKKQDGESIAPSPCAGNAQTTYTFTDGITSFTCELKNNAFILPNPLDGAEAPDAGWFDGCVWQWIGDAASSSEYDIQGPDVLSLSRFYDAGDMTVKWGIRYGTITDLVVYGTWFIDVDAASPVGSYDGGNYTIS